MKISVIGTGYVGLVTGTCLAEIGNDITCVDKDHKKIENLKNGILPIYEAHLEDMLIRNIGENRLHFTTSVEDAVRHATIIFIAVGTPSHENGDIDMSQVDEVAGEIGKSLDAYKIIVNKSTVPVGSVKRVAEIIQRHLKREVEFDVISNPEFLREGSAVLDTFQGDRIVIGSTSKKATKILHDLYRPLKQKIFTTDPESAELIKYASNAFLATKISFINEIANICEKTGANVNEVAKGMGLDKRIGEKFLNAGIGFGGACFPKDVKGLIKIGEKLNYDFRIIRETLQVNKEQKMKPIMILDNLFPDLRGVQITVLGLAFKPDTDDIREAPSLDIINELHKRGAKIKAYDPIAIENAKKVLKLPIHYFHEAYDAIAGSDAVLLLTEWKEFKELNVRKIRSLMNRRVFIDGRNIFEAKAMRAKGFEYYGIGIDNCQFTAIRSIEERMIPIENQKSHHTCGRAWN